MIRLGGNKKTHYRVGFIIPSKKTENIKAELVNFEIKVCRQRSLLISCHSQRSRSQVVTQVNKSKIAIETYL
jgi:hypothetical protein